MSNSGVGPMRLAARCALAGVALCACGRPDAAPRTGASVDTTSLVVVAAHFPRTGVAVRDSAGGWCAEFVIDSSATPVRNGDRVMIAFPGVSAVASLAARIAGPHSGQCHAEFAQPRWIDYSAYGLELTGARPAEGAAIPDVALVVASEAPWVRDTDGVLRADLDGDGVLEEARRCLADEGEHLTIWSPIPRNARVRRWHEYYDWGAFTNANCKPGEAGEGRGGD